MRSRRSRSALETYLGRLCDTTAERFGLNQRGGQRVLLALRRTPDLKLTPGGLAKQVVPSTGAMRDRLDRLEEAGLITRERDTQDRRSVIIRLTDRGAALIDEAIAAQVAEEKRVMGALKPDEQRRLNGLLRKLMLVFEDPS